MKKLSMLLSYVLCLSSTFAAALSPSSDFDDCDRVFPAQNVPGNSLLPRPIPMRGKSVAEARDARNDGSRISGAAIDPEAAAAADSGEASRVETVDSSVRRLLLSFAEEFDPDGAVASQHAPQTFSNVGATAESVRGLYLPPAAQPDGDKSGDQGVPPTCVDHPSRAMGTLNASRPDLKIYYLECDGDETSLKRFTTEALTADYAELSLGGTLEFIFIPEIGLQVDALSNTDESVERISYFDRIGWTANIRAWIKWWLNPWAWWNPSRYVLDTTNDIVTWDSIVSQATIQVTQAKDLTYITSQLRLFLLSDWTSKVAPYIASTTHKTFEHAVRLRFEKIEKPALEAVGFKNLTLGTRVNPATHRLERCIRVTK